MRHIGTVFSREKRVEVVDIVFILLHVYKNAFVYMPLETDFSHSASLGRFVPHHVVYGICRGLPNGLF